MFTKHFRVVVLLIIPVLTIGIFITDCFSPKEVNEGMWYLIPLLLSAYAGKRSQALWVAAGLSALTMAGFFLSPTETPSGFEWGLVNRLMGLGMLWVVALILAENHRQQERLRKLSRAVEQSPASIVITSKSGNIEYVNPKFTQLTGYSSEEVVGKNPRILKSGEMCAEGYRQLWQTITSGHEWSGEFHNKKKNGDLYWELASISPIFNEAGKLTHFLAVKEDITERKQAEESLRLAHERLRRFVDSNIVGVVIANAAGAIIEANDYYLNLIGFTREELVQGKVDWRAITPPEWLPADEQSIRELRDRGTCTPFEKEYVRRDGTRVAIFLTHAMLPGPGEQIAAFVLDITKRKRTEVELNWRTAFLEAQVNPSNDAWLVVDPNGKKIMQNQRMAEVWKIPPHIANDINDEAQVEFVTTKNKNPRQFVEKVKHLYAHPNETSHDELELLDGTILDRHSFPCVGKDGAYYGRIWTFRDITEYKRVENQTHEQARLLDMAHDAIIVRDLEGRIQYWNKGAETIYGWTAQEADGKKVSELLHEDSVLYEHARKTVMEKGRWKGELTIRDKNWQEVLVEANWTLVHDQQGIPKSILVIAADITEKKKLEAQFLRSQRMESVGTLASGIAHDLNNVLAPLLMSVQLLKEKTTDVSREKLLDTLENNVLRGANLVKQVLTFGRGLKGERISVQPVRIAREIEQIIHETFPKSVELDSHSSPGLWTVTGDPTQIHQVLLNLCVNARDAMPGGGKLSIHMENLVLDETDAALNSEAQPGPYVLISVTDTGTGIPKEIRDRIFEPFFTTKALGKGTGLGLSTTLGIVKNHGGFINCYSEADKGSAFKIYLPAVPQPASPENQVAKPSPLSHGRNELVLVVDDEQVIREVITKTLEHFGYRTLTAANGVEAVSLYTLRQHEIAVVITDMAMPVMDGPATITALKSINAAVLIIVTSGLLSDHDTNQALEAGVQHFISKPCTAENILQTLRAVLNSNGK